MREYELEKHMSLAQLQPESLAGLRRRGSCQFNVPEAVFDLDYPGQYFRRIHSLAVSIPSVAGPYANVSFALTLLRSRVRVNPRPAPSYAWLGPRDERFIEQASPSKLVASSSSPDAEMRYLPFEGEGAISAWHLELSRQSSPFDYTTIGDVILHMRYTARQGGEALRRAAVDSLRSIVAAQAENGPVKGPTRFVAK